MALSGSTVWEVRTAGSDNNGGGFVTGSSGTDWSQQNSAQYALTGLTSAGSGNTVLSAAAAVDMVGNVAHAVSGTNVNTGFFQVLSVSAGVSITFSQNNAGQSICSGVAASLVLNIGGALATVNQAVVNMAVSGMTAYVKSGSVYTRSSTMTIPNTGGAYYMIGYSNTRGDNGQATVTTASNITLVTYSTGNVWSWSNFIFSSTAATRGYGFDQTNSGYAPALYFINCLFTGLKDAIHDGSGITWSPLYFENCDITGCTNVGIEMASGNVATLQLVDTIIQGSTSDGVLKSSSALVLIAIRSVFYNNGGKGVNQSAASSAALLVALDCLFASNTSDGLTYGGSASSLGELICHNTIFYANGGYGININTGSTINAQRLLNCFFYNNTSGKYTSVVTNSVGEIIGTANPFTSIGTDFSLNTTAGGGAVCRNVGFPGTTQAFGTGYQDVGPLRHQDPAAGTSYLGGSSAGMASIMAM